MIGKYSYAIYIFHSPVHRVIRPYFADWLKTGSGNFRFASHVGFCLMVLAISLALALVTWNLIEQPFLALKRYFPMSDARNAGVRAEVTDSAGPPQESYAR